MKLIIGFKLVGTIEVEGDTRADCLADAGEVMRDLLEKVRDSGELSDGEWNVEKETA